MPSTRPRSARLRAATFALTLFASSWMASAADHAVSVNPDNTFTPAQLDIAIGDTVTWTNVGGLHNVDAPGFFRCATDCTEAGGAPMLPPWSFTRSFDEQVSIGYNCAVHLNLGMTGVINVGGGAATLGIAGSCPGLVVMNFAGLTPGGSAALLFSPTAGASTVPSGNCSGTQLGLAAPTLLTLLTADELGTILLERNIPATGCGKFLQLLDLTSCATTAATPIP